MDVRVGLWRKLSAEELMLLNCGVGEDSWSLEDSRSPLDCKEIQSILKEISPEYSLEGLMLKLKLQYFSHLMGRADSLEKTLMLGKTEGRKRRWRQRIDGCMASLTQWTWVWRALGDGITNSQSLLKFTSLQLVMPSNHLILCCPLLLPPSNFPSIRIFSNKSVLHIRWLKYWSFSFNIYPSNEYSGLISCRMDWWNSIVCRQLNPCNYRWLSTCFGGLWTFSGESNLDKV